MKAKTALPADWRVGTKVWVERAGQAILGQGKLELLEAIEQHRSISAAARAQGISYRHAWLMVQSINEASGEPLVVSATGGHRGGGAQLTNLGQLAVVTFREVQERLQQAALLLVRKQVTSPDSPVVHVAAAVCLEEVLGQLLTDYSLQHPDVRVRAIFGASDELAEHVLAGAPVDLFISAGREPLTRLDHMGMVEQGTRTLLAENTLAAVGPESGRPSVRSAKDLLHVERVALAEPDSPLGRYTRDYLDQAGLLERIRSRAVYVDNSRAVGAAVRAGNVDVGLFYGSDAACSHGCQLLFKVRSKQPSPIQLAAALLRPGQQRNHAQSLLAFFSSPLAARRFRKCGFLSPTQNRRSSVRR